MPTKHCECPSCEAVFKVRHDLDTHYYHVTHCAFCGYDLSEDEDEFDQEDLDEL